MNYLLAFCLLFSHCIQADKKLIMIAGAPSHGAGEHEYNAGCLLFKHCLTHIPDLDVKVYAHCWPEDDVLEQADAIFIYADGGGHHPALTHIKKLEKLIKKGVGLGCAHYAVEVPDEVSDTFKQWIGGYYKDGFSCNPLWTPEYVFLPHHPITQGIQPFSLYDEWYFSLCFHEITPILIAKPSDAIRNGPYVNPKGPYDHIVAAKNKNEIMMWTIERPDGGRGFGFTGGHYHCNWGNDNMRKLLLNALLWITKIDVPTDGVSSFVTKEDLSKNLDIKTGHRLGDKVFQQIAGS